jgi:hypothetical protein
MMLTATTAVAGKTQARRNGTMANEKTTNEEITMANETNEGHIPEFATPKAKAKRASKKTTPAKTPKSHGAAKAKADAKASTKKPRTTATERKGRAKAAAVAKAKNDQRKAIRAERAAKTTTTATPKPHEATQAKPTAAKKLSGLNAAAEVLAKSKEPLRAKEICERAIAMGWKTNGQTPEATLYAAMIREIAAKGKDSRFAKTDRGLFTANK